MKTIIKSILISSLLLSSAHAVEVNFENTGLMNLSNTFQGADITNANQTLSGIGAGFFGIDVTFSGGVLLENPLMGGTLTDPINCPTCGNVFYGSGLSQSTGVITDDTVGGVFQYLTPTISIDINPSEQITKVSGSLLSGLNTSIISPDATTDYLIDFLSADGSLFPDQLTITAGYDPDLFVPETFEFDTSTLMGSLANSIITGLRITAVGIDFENGSNAGLPNLPAEFNELEWDFLIDSVRFESNITPVPLPAGLPLFISALLSGFVIARPRKSSDTK